LQLFFPWSTIDSEKTSQIAEGKTMSEESHAAAKLLGSIKTEKKSASSRANLMRAKAEGKTGGHPREDKPWIALGISRQYWYAKNPQGKGKGKTSTPDRKA
jgi:hypothetical protein